MSKDFNIFEKDAVIPESVTKKANLAFSQIKMESEETKMKKRRLKHRILKGTIAVAACASVIVGSTMVSNIETIKNTEPEQSNKIKMAEATSDVAHMFSISVSAAELPTGMPLSFDYEASVAGFGFCADEATKHVDYQYGVPVRIVGEGIKSVTYTVNQGGFMYYHPEDENLVIDGEKASHDELLYWDDRACDFYIDYYKSYTLAYDAQTSFDSSISMFGSYTGEEMYNYCQKMWEDPKNDVALYNKILSDIILTVTVHYEDGFTSSQDLIFKVGEIFSKEDGYVNKVVVGHPGDDMDEALRQLQASLEPEVEYPASDDLYYLIESTPKTTVSEAEADLDYDFDEEWYLSYGRAVSKDGYEISFTQEDGGKGYFAINMTDMSNGRSYVFHASGVEDKLLGQLRVVEYPIKTEHGNGYLHYYPLDNDFELQLYNAGFSFKKAD